MKYCSFHQNFQCRNTDKQQRIFHKYLPPEFKFYHYYSLQDSKINNKLNFYHNIVLSCFHQNFIASNRFYCAILVEIQYTQFVLLIIPFFILKKKIQIVFMLLVEYKIDETVLKPHYTVQVAQQLVLQRSCETSCCENRTV